MRNGKYFTAIFFGVMTLGPMQGYAECSVADGSTQENKTKEDFTMNEMSTTSAWVTDRFSRAELFEKLGIDYCCKGRSTLKEVCEEKGLCTDDVLRELRQWDRGSSTVDCSHMTARELCDHIIETHHAYLRRMIPLVQAHLEKIVKAHGEKYSKLQKTFERFKQEIESHMKEEEEVAFPAICSHDPKSYQFVDKLEGEHRAAGALLDEIRELTNDFTPPPQACTTLKTTWAELAEIERDMHRHVYKENYLLFPLAN